MSVFVTFFCFKTISQIVTVLFIYIPHDDTDIQVGADDKWPR